MRRRRHRHDDPNDLAARVRALEARPRSPKSSVVPIPTQDEGNEDDRYGIQIETRPNIGMMHFPENPHDGQYYWLHEPLTGEMYLFVFCEMYAKWISPTYYQAVQTSQTFTEIGTSYAARTSAEIGRITIPNGRALWDVGVSFEVTASGRMHNTGGGITRARIAWYDWALADTGLGTATRFSSVFREDAAAGVNYMTVLDWEQFPDDPDPSGSHFTFVLQTEVNSGTGTYADCQFTVRLVHDVEEAM